MNPVPFTSSSSAAESSGAQLFVAGNIHASTVTLYSVLLASDDSGLTWRETHPRIRGAGLDHIQFLDTATGWAGGEVLFPLPRDPFLLLTTDGGRSWRQRPFVAETSPGSLQQFLFTSRTSGSAILDRGSGNPRERYARYETPDGGETWAIPAGEQSAPRSGPSLRRSSGVAGARRWTHPVFPCRAAGGRPLEQRCVLRRQAKRLPGALAPAPESFPVRFRMSNC